MRQVDTGVESAMHLVDNGGKADNLVQRPEPNEHTDVVLGT